MKDDTAEVLSIAGREVRVTHPDKPYFSKQTKLSKLDLVRYYLSVAPGALTGIRDRPLVLKRFVDGAEGEAFYQILSLAQGRPESSHQRPDIRHPLEPQNLAYTTFYVIRAQLAAPTVPVLGQ